MHRGLPATSHHLLLTAAAAVGASAILTQLVLLREVLAAFSGNELVLGVALSNWLLLTGVGAVLGQWRPWNRTAPCLQTARPLRAPVGATDLSGSPSLIAGLASIALLPLGQVLAVRVLRDLVFVRGASVSLAGTTLASGALLAPFCLLSGALLPFVTGLLARRGADAPTGRTYLADTLGSLAGGVLFCFGLVPWLDHFTILLVPAFLNLSLAALLAHQSHRPRLALAALLTAAALMPTLLEVDLDAWSTARQYPGRVVARVHSPYGRLVVTEDSGQLTFYENGTPTFGSDQPEHIEETVHYALSQRPDARRVLLIGGGLSGTAAEILRWGVERVTYVELDPRLPEVGQRLLPHALDDPRIKTITTDGRRFVQRTAERFDVVVIDLPDPATAQLNRYFTSEFFAEVKRALVPGGVISFGLGRYGNYVSRELAAVLATAHRTLATAFPHVEMIPGGRVYFAASDARLTLDIAGRLEARGLATRHVHRHSLAATLAPDRLADLARAVAVPAGLNTDLQPVLFFQHLVHWRSQFASSRPPLLGLGFLAAGLGCALVRLRTVPRIVCAAGFAASGLEVVLLLAFQALYGALYQQVGLLITVFMAGFAAGAWASIRTPAGGADHPLRRVRQFALGIAALAAVLPWLLPSLRALAAGSASTISGQVAILGLTFVLAALVGAQFAYASSAEVAAAPTVAARLFSADLLGASIGAWSVSALLIPRYGVLPVCLAIATLNLAAALPRPLRKDSA